MSNTPLTFETKVNAAGRIEVATSLPPDSPVTVVVLKRDDDFADLIAAAGANLAFWDNPIDDEEWNDAGHG